MRGTPLPWLALVAIVLGACSTPGATVSPPPVSIRPSATEEATATPVPTSPAIATPTPTPAPLAWTQLDVDGPPAREDHTWTLVPGGEIAYLFGGRDGSTVFDDTWAFDLNAHTWTRLEPPSRPAARFGHEAAWVDGVGLVVFAGQADASTFFNDLWAYEPTADAWTELPATGAQPTARYGSCASVGPDGRLWISHGFTEDGARFSDTRAYDFATSTWTDETPDGPRPVERCLHGCWWTDDGALALYAGQTTGVTALDDRWLLADGRWSLVEGALPPARNLYARARLDGATLVFGGQALDGSFHDDLWLLTD
ncbi:MAG: Kelch repeat-containing protein, partial [Candidatus Limnocylindria bacterium]